MMQGKKSEILIHMVLIVMCMYALGPLLLLIQNSFKSASEMVASPLGFPTKFLWRNYVEAWQVAGYTKGLLNNAILISLTLAILLPVSSLMAFALVKLDLPGGDILLTFLLVGMTLPGQLYLIPLFFMWQRLGLVNSILGLAPIYAAHYLPFSVFIMRASYLGIPKEIEDSARIDGYSEFRVYLHVTLPLSKPALLTLIAIISMWIWNEFLFALTFLHSEPSRTVAIRYYYFTGRFAINLAYVAAGGVLVIVPIIILYIFLQKAFVGGMTYGAMKG